MDYIDPVLLRSFYPTGNVSFLDNNRQLSPEEQFFRIFSQEVMKNTWEEESDNALFDNNFYRTYTNDIFSDIIAQQLAEEF